jgi:hypothetical protein
MPKPEGRGSRRDASMGNIISDKVPNRRAAVATTPRGPELLDQLLEAAPLGISETSDGYRC